MLTPYFIKKNLALFNERLSQENSLPFYLLYFNGFTTDFGRLSALPKSIIATW